jgi:hypothetical protein
LRVVSPAKPRLSTPIPRSIPTVADEATDNRESTTLAMPVAKASA